MPNIKTPKANLFLVAVFVLLACSFSAADLNLYTKDKENGSKYFIGEVFFVTEILDRCDDVMRFRSDEGNLFIATRGYDTPKYYASYKVTGIEECIEQIDITDAALKMPFGCQPSY